MNHNKQQEKTLKASRQFHALDRFPKGVRVEVWTVPDEQHNSGSYMYLRIVSPGLHLTSGLPFHKDPLLREEVTSLFGALVGNDPETMEEFSRLVFDFCE